MGWHRGISREKPGRHAHEAIVIALRLRYVLPLDTPYKCHVELFLSVCSLLFKLPAAVVPPDVGAPSPTVSPKSQRGSPTVPSVQQAPTTPLSSTHPAFSAPLLNLTGAPSLALEEIEGPPPKKRRRKRKKKRQTGDQVAVGGDPP